MLGISPGYYSHRQDRVKLSEVRAHCEPWTHYVCDNFVEPGLLAASQEKVLFAKHRFNIQPDDPNRLRFKLLSDIGLARIFLSIQFLRLIQNIANCQLQLNRSNAVQLRMMDRRSPAFPPHCDTFDGARSLVAMFYMSPEWNSACGGRLNLHRSQDGEIEASIEPIENRLVLFFGDYGHWHSVESVYGKWRRFSIMSEWFVI